MTEVYKREKVRLIPPEVEIVQAVVDPSILFRRSQNVQEGWVQISGEMTGRLFNNEADLLFGYPSGVTAWVDRVEEAKEFFRKGGESIDWRSNITIEHASALIVEALKETK